MNLIKTEKLANELLKKHGLINKGWRFEFDNAPRRFGCCKYRSKRITLSKKLTELNDEENVLDTILHEMAHLIDFKMQKLGEKTIASSSGYYDASVGNQDSYVQSDTETFARVQRLREALGLNPNANGNDIKQKLIEFIKSKKLTFPNVKISNVKSPTGLMFIPLQTSKGALSELWKFYSSMKINGTSVPDISALFGKYSSYQTNGSVVLNLDIIGKVNVSTKALPNNTTS
jgi:hypothetical protein